MAAAINPVSVTITIRIACSDGSVQDVSFDCHGTCVNISDPSMSHMSIVAHIESPRGLSAADLALAIAVIHGGRDTAAVLADKVLEEYHEKQG